MRGVLPVLALLLAGCLAPGAPPTPAATDAALSSVRLTPEGVDVDVPIDVVLVGFAPSVAQALEARLEPERVVQFASDDWRDVPPNASRAPHVPTFKDFYVPLPLTPTAQWRIHAAPQSFAEALFEAGRATALNATVLDANAVEDWLADRLPDLGVPVDASHVPLVILHGGDAWGRHAWRLTFGNGHLEPVRVFGERRPVLVLDASAEADPYQARDPVGDPAVATLLGGSVEGAKAYETPLSAEGEATADALVEAAVDAARYRLLHGSAVPPSRKPCHGVTLIVAERATAVAGRIPGAAPPEALVLADELRAGWERMTGEGTVHVDLKVLHLPQDDPALEAASRPGTGAIGGTRGGWDAMRWWITTHWQDYWVEHEGCEAYVSVVFLGDATDDPAGTLGYSGIAMYDATDDRRISASVLTDRHRAAAESSSPLSGLVFLDDPSIVEWRAVLYLFSHETGHLMGPHHPHNNQRPERVELRSWSSVWTPMSYQVNERSAEFGVVERANWLRNRAGFALADARGQEGAPEFGEALAALAAQDWETANERLLSLR